MRLRSTPALVREAIRNAWEDRGRGALSLAVIAGTVLSAGLFLALSDHLRSQAADLARGLTIVAYLAPGLPEAGQSRIAERIEGSPLVSGARIIGEAEAAARFDESFPELREVAASLGRNPFPPSIEISLADPGLAPERAAALIEEIRAIEGVEDVQYSREWAGRVRAFGRLARTAGYVLGGILALASGLVISAAVRLSALGRRPEIEILRLVGASNAYIRAPFLVEGMLLGLAGSLIGAGLVFAALEVYPVIAGTSLGAFRDLVQFEAPTIGRVGVLAVSGTAVGLLGAWSAVSEALQT